MASYKRNFTVRTSRVLGKRQRDQITLLGSVLSSLKSTTKGRTTVPAADVRRLVSRAIKHLTKIDKHDQAIWAELLDDKNDQK